MPLRDDSLAWQDLPIDTRTALDDWLRRERFGLSHKGWFRTGRSQDWVGLVERFRAGSEVRQLVAKFCRKDAEAKVNRVGQADESSPAAFRPHLATSVGPSVPLSTWRLIFQDVAWGDVSTVRPLIQLLLEDDPDFPAYCRRICRSLISDWNDEPDQPTIRTTAAGFLRRVLGERIHKDGPIRRWAAEAGVPGTGSPTAVTRPGWDRPLLNPFALVNQFSVARTPVPSMLLGRAHGDLNGRNILVPTRPVVQPDRYVLIDLDRFDAAAPLTRDPMHLLVALAMDIFASDKLGGSDRRRLVEAIIDPYRTASEGLEQFRQISVAVHEGTGEWADGAGYGADWRQQCALSLVAAALMNLGRRWIPPEDKEWCFELAANAADRFSQLVVSEDPTGPTPPGATADRSLPLSEPAPPTASPPVSTAEADGLMDTIRVSVWNGNHGAELVAELTDRVRDLPVDVRPLTAHHTISRPDASQQIREEIAQADALVAVLTDDLRTDGKYVTAERFARHRGLPILVLRMHSAVEAPLDPPCLSFGPGCDRPQWDELIPELRWIGSPAYLADAYNRRVARLEERFSQADGRAQARIGHEIEAVYERLAEQRARARSQGSSSRAARGRSAMRSATTHRGRLRCYGQPRPVPPERPIDRLTETADLLKEFQPPRGPVALVGLDGVGKTAIVSRLLQEAEENASQLRIDGFVYLAARDPYLLDAASVLTALTEVVPDAEKAERARRAVGDQGRSWTDKLDRVLEALGDQRVLLVLDDVQELLDDEHRFRDRHLADVLTAVAEAERPLQLLVVGTCQPVEPAMTSSPPLDRGLDKDEGWKLLRSMDPDDLLDLSEHAGASEELADLTVGHPRLLELVAAVLHGDPEITLPELIAAVRRERRSQEPVSSLLFARVLEGLDRIQLRVLQALALFDWPVDTATVDAVLAPYLPGQSTASTLAELARRRLLRTDGTYYALPRDSNRAALLDRLDVGDPADRTRVPPPLNRRALYHLAAEHYAQDAPHVDGRRAVGSRIAEVELRIAGGDRTAALKAMELLDSSYLRARGSSSALIHLREQVVGDGDFLDINNLSRLADAWLQQDEARPAVRALYDALSLCDRQQRRESACKILIQLGNAFLNAGNSRAASIHYRQALAEAEARDLPVQAGQAMAGLMRCRSDRADFESALNLYHRAEVVLTANLDRTHARRTRASLLLALGNLQGRLGNVFVARHALHDGENEALSLNDRRLYAALIGERAVLCLDVGQPDIAMSLADEAVQLATSMNNIPVRREAATTLAQAHLSMGTHRLPEARAAADSAVRLSQAPRAVGAFVVQGIAALRLASLRSRPNDLVVARSAFQSARDRADQLRRQDRRNFEMHDLLGLANCGLGLCGVKSRFGQAVRAFEEARRITSGQAVVLRVQRLLLQMVDPADERTRDVLQAAGGECP